MFFKYLENHKFIAFSHRGGSLENNENTISAFQNSIELGYQYIETDVQSTKDDKLVIFHDNDLKRIANQNINIADINYDDLRNIKIFNNETIPLLKDTIEELKFIKFNIDPKSDRAAIILNSILKKRKDLDRFCIGSFFQHRVNLFRNSFLNKITTSMSKQEVVKLFFNQYLHLFKQDTPCIQVPVSFKGIKIITKKLIDFIHIQNKKIHVWTIDDQTEMQRLIDLGVDGIMTDRPSILKDVLIKNNLWN